MKFSTLEELKVRQLDVFGRLFESVRRQVGQNWPVQDSRGFIFSVPKTQPEAGTVRHGCLVWNTDLWYTKTALYVEVVAATSFVNLTSYHSHEILHFGGAEGTPMGPPVPMPTSAMARARWRWPGRHARRPTG